MRHYITVCLLLVFANLTFCQAIKIGGNKSLDFRNDQLLHSKFSAFEVFNIESSVIASLLHSPHFNDEVLLDLGPELNGLCHLEAYNMKSKDHITIRWSGDSLIKKIDTISFTFRGHFKNNPDNQFALTVTDGFVLGYFIKDGSQYMLEPIRTFDKSYALDDYIVYNSKDILVGQGLKCGADIITEKYSSVLETRGVHSGDNKCAFQVELAIASDWSMFLNKGSQEATNIFVDAVMNNVQLLYDNEFNDSLKFVIVSHYVSSSANDPLEIAMSSALDPNILLANFSGWGNAGNFGTNFDIGQFWTKRDFEGGLVGLAYVGTVCTGTKYHVLQEFTGNNVNFALQVLTAHEIGHNFSCKHDESTEQFIMKPSISNVSSWSPKSQNAVNAYYSTLSCLQPIGTRLTLDKKPILYAMETAIDGSITSNCNQKYNLYYIPVKLFRAEATSSITALLTADISSTAIQNKDYSIVVGSVTFPAGSSNNSGNFIIAIFDDNLGEPTENAVLNLNAGSHELCSSDNITFNLLDDDNDPTDLSNRTIVFGAGDSETSMYPFKGSKSDARSLILYTASQLKAYGISAGYFYEIGLFVNSKNSTQPYNGFMIKAKNTSNTFGSFSEANMKTIFSGSISTTNGWNTFALSDRFFWDGKSNILLEFCFDNAADSDDDLVSCTLRGSYVAKHNRISDVNAIGCTLPENLVDKYQPDIKIGYIPSIAISNDENKSAVAIIGNGDKAHFYDDEGKALINLGQTEGTDLGCVKVMIDRAGNGGVVSPSWLDIGQSSQISRKTFYITSANNANYDITLLYNERDISAILGNPATFKMLKTPGPIQHSTSSEGSILVKPTYNSYVSEGGIIHAFTSSFNSFSGFAITNFDGFLPINLLSFNAIKSDKNVDLIWVTNYEENTDRFFIQRSTDGINFYDIGNTKAAGFSANKKSYQFQDKLPIRGVSYYRLKTKNIDNSEDYSIIIQVVFDSSFSILLYPNPITEPFFYLQTGEETEIFQVEVYDNRGVHLFSKRSGRNINSGVGNTFSISLEGFPSGQYIVKVINSGSPLIFKVSYM